MKKSAVVALLLAAAMLFGGCVMNGNTESSAAESSDYSSSQVEASQAEASQSEASQAEVSQVETSQSEASQAEVSQAETSQSEVSQAEASQVETSQSEASQAEVSQGEESADNTPRISADKQVYADNETISISFSGTDTKDWVGIYAGKDEPGIVASLVWKYSVGEGKLDFSASSLGKTGEFGVFLCDNDGYLILDSLRITVYDSDGSDYGAESLEVNGSVTDGIRSSSAVITPSSGAELTYLLYWSAGNTRLEGYEPIKKLRHSGEGAFTVNFNDCMYMPSGADGIEVAVLEGRSTSCFAPAPKELAAEGGDMLFSFNVITDLHISDNGIAAQCHLLEALADISELDPESIGIFTCGDNTDRGTASNYKLLLDTVAKAGEIPKIYFGLGNHDIVYGGSYEEQIELFKTNTGAPGAYYSVSAGGSLFIFLGSDTKSSTGTIGQTQLEFLASELEKNGSEKPVFVFLHQPLIETVAGSLYSRDHEIQDWYGITATGSYIRQILAKYPNAFLFTGHTHWEFDCFQPILAGYGKDANFIGCASVGYLWCDGDTATGGSQGMFVEVYADRILLRGREFVNNSWCSAAQFCIPLV